MSRKAKPVEDRDEPAAATEELVEPAKAVKLVRMARGDAETADVHPDEVENFAAGGWVAK